MANIAKNIKTLGEDVTTFDDPQIVEYTDLLTNIRNQLTSQINKTLSQSNIGTIMDPSDCVARLLDQASDGALSIVTDTLSYYTKANRDQRGKQLEGIIVSIYEVLYYSLAAITLTLYTKLAQVQNLKLDIIKIVPGGIVIQISTNQTTKLKLSMNMYYMLDQIEYESIWQMLDSKSISPLLGISYNNVQPSPRVVYEDNAGSYTTVYYATFTDLYKKLRSIIK